MKNEKMLLYKKIMVTIVSSGMLLLPNWGYALPQGGQVVGGSGSIGSPGGGVMDITGNGGNLAIDWDSFNIAQGETVNFKNMQAVLNYVTGSQRSEIFGKLNGSGAHVFLLNPNGILFGAAAEVNVGSLTASTRSLPEEARKGFNGTLGNLDVEGIAKIQADIVNLGTIAADAINFEGNNISIIKADTLQIQGGDLGKVSLKAKDNINIGYEVTDKTTIDVGDGSGGHTVSDYSKGGGTKASSLGIVTAALDGSEKNITDCMLVHDVYELQAINNNYETEKNSANFDYSYVNGDYMLANEIDASVTSSWNSGQGFACLGALKQLPMGTPSGFQGGFTGSLDGMGYTISDLTIERSGESYVGLFGCLTESARVTNLTLSGSISGQRSEQSPEQQQISWSRGRRCPAFFIGGSMSTVLKMEHIEKVYGNQVRALHDISLEVRAGEFVAVIGPSGSGKSTLLRTVNQLVVPSGGHVYIDGEEVTGASGKKLRLLRRKVGMIFQHYNLVQRLSVMQNVLHGRLGYMSALDGMLGNYTEEDKRKAIDLLQEIEMGDRLYNRASDLSGGQKQRVGIARAIMQEPKLLLCDEPIASLDPNASKIIMDLIYQMTQRRNIACIVNLHQLDVAMRYATRIIGLAKGEMIFDGTPQQLNNAVIEKIYNTSMENLIIKQGENYA